jgi:hypothetical protein
MSSESGTSICHAHGICGILWLVWLPEKSYGEVEEVPRSVLRIYALLLDPGIKKVISYRQYECYIYTVH